MKMVSRSNHEKSTLFRVMFLEVPGLALHQWISFEHIFLINLCDKRLVNILYYTDIDGNSMLASLDFY